MIRPIDLQYPRCDFDAYDQLYNRWKSRLILARVGEGVVFPVDTEQAINVTRLVKDLQAAGWEVEYTTTIRPEIHSDSGKRPAVEVPAVLVRAYVTFR